MKHISLLVLLFILLGCSNDNGSTDPIENPILPSAAFSADKTSVEEGDTVQFTDSSQHASTYTWAFEGGTPAVSSSKNQDVVYDTPGVYAVSLKVTNSDGEDSETKNDYITVTEKDKAPEADFAASETTIGTGNQITFTDTSTNGPTAWSWEFEGGNPETSTEQNPTVTYENSGVFTVTLTAANTFGETSNSKTDFITVNDPVLKPEADFSASETTIESGNSITFTDTSTNGPTSWSWEFEGGDPAISEEQNPTINYNGSGIYEVTLTATNTGGSDTETKSGYIVVNQQTASYTVTFEGTWTASSHPIDFPTDDDHFSSAIGLVHKAGTTIFEEGQLATDGIENMAESGNNANLIDEIDALVDSGSALNRISGGGLGSGTSETSFTITATEEFSLVTIVSMIAPSPDWFVAVENVDLFNDGEFADNITVAAVSYDSGTDSGSSFNSGNDDTDPAENISLITDAPLGNGTTVDPPVAIFTFVKN